MQAACVHKIFNLNARFVIREMQIVVKCHTTITFEKEIYDTTINQK